MIKRDGVAVMNERTGNVKMAREILEVLKTKSYRTHDGTDVDISTDLDAAVAGTILYKDSLPGKNYPANNTFVEITKETTVQAAVRSLSQGKTNVVALNFASARNPGGGFLSGALAQEEDLARASGLYACLKSKPIFYNENILCHDSLYTHNIIHSPNVPFFRDENNWLDEPFSLSIISAPAPNVRAEMSHEFSSSSEKIYSLLFERATRILRIAEAHGHTNIILGAWGCGAFGNDPDMVAKVFGYAIFDNKEGAPIYNSFKKIIG
jgi:uncharacterized protein (TIGR02452 family)